MSAKKRNAVEGKQSREEQENAQSHGKLREYFESLIVAIILALIIKTFVVQTFQIPTGSMEDGLLVGDHLIVNKLTYAEGIWPFNVIFPIRDVKRGDVVVFKYPPDERQDFIKRVIGLPGETIRIHQHQIYINGTPVEELGLDEDRYTFQWRNADTERTEAIGADPYDPARDAFASVPFERTIPEGEYFMMGDHRSNSLDSRVWGTVPREYIKGKATLIYWSYESNREDYAGGGNIVSNIANILAFPFKTRWTRLLHIIH